LLPFVGSGYIQSGWSPDWLISFVTDYKIKSKIKYETQNRSLIAAADTDQ